ncbi:MAG: hypothetical protein ACOZE5_18365 [Verrucomicrobiota bacterium]
MSIPGIIRQHQQLLALGVSVLSAVLLGFMIVPDHTALLIVMRGGYWIMLVMAVLFGSAVWKSLRRHPESGEGGWRAWLAVAVCAALLLVHEAYGFKVLMDEAMLLGTSMTMHFEKEVMVPMRAHEITGYFQTLDAQLDKRPLFFPFLVSVLHDFTGYRPENPWILNTALTFLFCSLVFVLGRRLTGRWQGGIVALLLMAGLPLLAQNATGAGFELLNLVMLALTMLSGIRWLERRDGDSLTVFCYAGALLAQVRYESVLFLLPVALLVLWGWWLEQRILLTWPVVVLPLLLVAYPLQHRVFTVRESAWELASQPGYHKVFSPDYALANFGHALNFLFDTTGDVPNSLVLSCLGAPALVFLLLWVLRLSRNLRAQPAAAVVFGVFTLGFALWLGLMLCYFWGRFDDPVIRRLSLPLHLWMALAIVVVIDVFDRPGRSWRWWTAALALALVGGSIPVMARHAYTQTYNPGLEVQWRREFIAAHPERDYLFIDRDAVVWITHLVSATSVLQARTKPELFEFNLRNRSFSAIYAYQRFNVDPDTGRLLPELGDYLGPEYVLETVAEKRFAPLRVSRISRVTEVRRGAPAPVGPVAGTYEKLSPEERERIRLEYFENYVKHLP